MKTLRRLALGFALSTAACSDAAPPLRDDVPGMSSGGVAQASAARAPESMMPKNEALFMAFCLAAAVGSLAGMGWNSARREAKEKGRRIDELKSALDKAHERNHELKQERRVDSFLAPVFRPKKQRQWKN